MIKRKLESAIMNRLFKCKAIIVLGPRQTGKTTLLKEIADRQNDNVLWLDADEPFVRTRLTGRKFEFFLYPVSYEEMVDHHGWLEEKRFLEQRLIYGSYPGVVSNVDKMKEILGLLAGSYLYKDIFKYRDLRRPEFWRLCCNRWLYSLEHRSLIMNWDKPLVLIRKQFNDILNCLKRPL